MKILMLHNRYKIPGGEDVCTHMQVDALRSNGHYVELVEESNEHVDVLGMGRTAVRTIWSQESFSRVEQLLAEKEYDVMHVQNFFPLLSPSVYYAAQRHGVPVIQALHNFRLLCPEGTLYRDGRVCMDCVGRNVAWPGIKHACYRGSRAGSSVVAAMSSTHRLVGTWKNRVDLYVTPSQYAMDAYVQAGWDPKMISVIPNFVDPDPGLGSGSGGYALYVGRLARAKGIETLLAAWQQLGLNHPLKIAGDGDLRAVVERAAEEHPSITYLGPVSHQRASELMGEAMFVIVPTVGTETFGLVVAEALATGTPALVSDTAALAELIDEGGNGLLLRPGDSQHLADSVDWMFTHPEQLAAMRQSARATFLSRFTRDRASELWMVAYRSVIDG